MRFLHHPDTVLTASDLETLAVGLFDELPLPGVEGCRFDSGVIWETVTQAAVDQKSINAVTDTTLKTYSDDYTFNQLHTIPPDELEDVVNDLLAQQAAMILGPTPRIICLDFLDIHYHGSSYYDPAELCHTAPRDGTSQCHRYLVVLPLVHSISSIQCLIDGDAREREPSVRHVLSAPLRTPTMLVLGSSVSRIVWSRGVLKCGELLGKENVSKNSIYRRCLVRRNKPHRLESRRISVVGVYFPIGGFRINVC